MLDLGKVKSMKKTESEKRQYYSQIAKRSFKTVFDQYLFYRISRGLQSSISVEDFKTFLPEQSIINEYVNEYWQKEYQYQRNSQWQLNIKQIEASIYNWEKEIYNKQLIKDSEEYYVNTRFNKIFSFEKFVKLLEERTCKYCGISENKIEELISKHKIFKKKVTRGWTLEIDRKKPNTEYTDENCVICCYWCNSAKTDEFDDIEFIPIGKAIKQIWNARLKS